MSGGSTLNSFLKKMSEILFWRTRVELHSQPVLGAGGTNDPQPLAYVFFLHKSSVGTLFIYSGLPKF